MSMSMSMSPTPKVSPLALARTLQELWSPRVVAVVDGYHVKVAKVHGTFGWHAHPHEDELFQVLEGHLRIELEDGAVELDPGEVYVVPKGVRHNPVAESVCLIQLFEHADTAHSGTEVLAWTRSAAEQLRPL